MQTATNKQTGERFYLEGDQWVPLKTATNQDTGEQFGLIDNQWVPLASPPPDQPEEEKGLIDSAFEAVSDVADAASEMYAVDKAKSAIGNFVSSVLPDQVKLSLLGIDPLDYTNEDNQFDKESILRLEADVEAGILDAKEEFLGYRGIKPETELGRMAGESLESVISEGPLAFVGAKGVTSGLAELLHSYTATLFGRAGAELTAEGVELLGGGETAQRVAGAIGGITAGASTIPGRAALGGTVKAASEGLARRKEINKDLDTATDYVASASVRRVIDKATEADPNIDAVVKATKDLEDAVPGLAIPPITALADNPIYKKNIEYLLRTNPEFYAKAKASLDDAVKAIDARKEKLFGTTGPEADAAIRRRLPRDYTAILSGANKRKNALAREIDKLSDTVRTSNDFVDIGKRAGELIEAKRKAVSAKIKPQYQTLFKNAEEKGVVFPAESVGEIHRAYRALRNQDVFASFPELGKKLEANWAPQKTEVSPGILPGQQRVATVDRYNAVSLSEMDSFKRELNRAIRKSGDDAELRILQSLKDTFRGELDKMAGDFGKKYRDLDLAFYKELGVPLNKAEMRQFDAAKFDSQVGSYLAKPEQAREFVSFVGPAGAPVVRDAVFLKMSGPGLQGGGVFTKGALDPTKLAAFINKNKKLIDTVPGLRGELTDARNLVNKLTQTKARIDSEYNIKVRELTDGFYQAFEQKGLSQVASNILQSNKESARYLKQIKNFDPETSRMVRQGVRAALLERGVASSKTMVDFIREHETVFTDWFGPRYLKNVEAIGAASDLVSKVDIENMRFAIDVKEGDQLLDTVGISGPQLQSVVRDRISGGLTKLAIIGSKVSATQAAAKRDGKMMDLLLNPGALEAIKNQVGATKGKVVDDKVLAEMAQIFNNAVYKGLYFASQSEQEVAEERRLEAANSN